MARTESKAIQVHPDREQATIQFMQIFHWNLMNSQHVKTKTKDSHLERRGDEIWSVTETETEHYVNLTFSRDLDAPGIDRIRALENEHNALSASMPEVPRPSGFVFPIIVCFFLSLFYGAGIVLAFFWLPSISAKNKRVEAEAPAVIAQRQRMMARQTEIEEECQSANVGARAVQAVASLPPPPSGQDDDVAFWDRMEKSDADQLQEYLLRFPRGKFVELAKSKLERMGIEPFRPSEVTPVALPISNPPVAPEPQSPGASPPEATAIQTSYASPPQSYGATSMPGAGGGDVVVSNGPPIALIVILIAGVAVASMVGVALMQQSQQRSIIDAVSVPPLAEPNTPTGDVTLPGGTTIDAQQAEQAAKQMEQAFAGTQAGGAAKPIDLEQLSALLPQALPGGFTKTESSSGAGAAGGMNIGNAEAIYRRGDSRLTLTVTDMGAAGALAGMAAAMNVQSNRETADGYERTRTENGRMVTEVVDRSAKTAEYQVVTSNRISVSAQGSLVSIEEARAAVEAVLYSAEALLRDS